jgi:dihydroorotate dehydrogenase (NAD+) catalytic subunit
MTAAGTSGHGAELAEIGAISSLGAVVVKSLAAFPWPGNPQPRLHPLPNGMLNAVGLQGLGIDDWAQRHLDDFVRHDARAVISIWGRSVEEYQEAADCVERVLTQSSGASHVVAVEVNLSCPNLAGHGIIAHDIGMSADIIRCCARLSRPVWAKLSPNTDRIVDTAKAVHEAGAQAVTLVNTVSGLVLDQRTGRSVLGNNAGGGLSGRSIHPVAVKAVHDVYSADPEIAIIGVGGVTSAWEAVELMLVGARAVQVGTATFADPRAPFRIASDLVEWAGRRGMSRLSDLTGLYHRGGFDANQS